MNTLYMYSYSDRLYMIYYYWYSSWDAQCIDWKECIPFELLRVYIELDVFILCN